MEQGYNSSKLIILAKDMLAKTRDEILPQKENNKQTNEKAMIITTWDPALKHLFETEILNTSRKISTY